MSLPLALKHGKSGKDNLLLDAGADAGEGDADEEERTKRLLEESMTGT
jgi:hypothetical protein